MDVVALMKEAKSAGVSISLDGHGGLVIEAKPSQRDWLQRLRPYKAEIKALLNGASTVESAAWPVPKPLPSALPPVAEFDDSLLPEVARPMVNDIAERMQCPPDFPAVSLMTVFGSLIGRQCAIRPKRRDDWEAVPNLWGLVIGRPGILKSPAVDGPLRILRRFEAEAAAKYAKAIEEFQYLSEVRKAQQKSAKQKLEKAAKDGLDESELLEMVQECAGDDQPPVQRRFLLNDPSVEKLGEILRDSPLGQLLERDEIYGFLKSLDKEGHESARGFYLQAWNGHGRYAYDRIGRGHIPIEAAIVSILGTIQPGRLREYVSHAVRGGSGDDGLIQRFQLAVWPNSPGTWRNVDRWPDTTAKNQVYEVAQQLSVLSVDGWHVEENEIPYLRFMADAQEAFDAWRCNLEHRLRGDELVPAMESHLAKYRSLLPSLALICHLVDSGVGDVQLSALDRAIRWVEYLETHARRIYAIVIDSGVSGAHELARRIKKGDLADGFALRTIYRKGWSELDDKDSAEAAIEVLLEHHWIEEVQNQNAKGGPKATIFKINPRISEITGTGTDKTDKTPQSP